jgi:SWI/SNF-related matrix-associated actin-dependent regulator 1 of chromatin subfamily A
LYRLACQAGQDEAARDQISYIVSQFVSFQQLQRPLLQAFEGVAEVAAKFPAIEREATALRVQVSERDTGLASAQLRADAAEARLADALAEIEGQRAQIADLASAQLRADATEARLADALGEIERESATLKVALAEREAALKRAEEERAAATVTLEAEFGALQEKVAQAEREATERRTTTAALEAQIAALQDTLTAAREVGKAALAAFRLDIAAPVKPDRQGGWRRGIMRFFGAQPSF